MEIIKLSRINNREIFRKFEITLKYIRLSLRPSNCCLLTGQTRDASVVLVMLFHDGVSMKTIGDFKIIFLIKCISFGSNHHAYFRMNFSSIFMNNFKNTLSYEKYLVDSSWNR